MDIFELCRIKVGLLVRGVNLNLDILDQLAGTYKENNYGYNNPNKSDNVLILEKLPTEIILNDQTIVSFRYNPVSEYSIKLNGDVLHLYKGNIPLCKVVFSRRPYFWSKMTRNGIPMKRIGSVYGESALTFFLINFCQFFNDGNQCRFCSLNKTYETIKSVEYKKTIDNIIDVFSASEPEHYSFTNFIGGSLYDTDKEFSMYINYIDQICNQMGIDCLNGYVVSQPPRENRLLGDLRKSGINGVKFNLEVTSEELFRKLCPGKERFGYTNIQQKLYEAVSVFGKNHVYTNLILGLEPTERIIQKAEELAEMDIGVVPHIFHGDYGTNILTTYLDIDKLLQAYCEIDKINKAHGIIPWLDKQSSRGCLSWDIY